MNRNEFTDRINYCKRELDWLIAQPTNCTTCAQFVSDAKVCDRYGPVPAEFIDQTSLIGPAERIRDRFHAFAESGVTTLTVATYAGSLEDRIATLRTVADALEASGLAE